MHTCPHLTAAAELDLKLDASLVVDGCAHASCNSLLMSWIIEAWFSNELKTGNFGGPQIQEAQFRFVWVVCQLILEWAYITNPT